MKILPYKTGDEHAILNLFERSFGKKLSIEYWNWRFANHPSGIRMIMLMWDGDTLVGHYAVSPAKLVIHQQEILTALSMTTMTDPAYSGRGIFTQLANALYEEQNSTNGLSAVWGYPNNNSHYGFIKNLNWVNLEQVPTFTIDASHIETIHSAVSVSHEFAHAERFVYKQSPVRMKLDTAYLKWRYELNPQNKYVVFEREYDGLISYAVAKLFDSFSSPGQTEVDILEWQVPADEHIQSEFLSAIKVHFAQANVLRFNMWLPLHDKRHIQLEKLGFRNHAPITYFGIRLLDSRLEALLDARNWQHSLGYSDIY